MSSLPPLGPKYQAMVERNYAGALHMLDTAVASAETDPKRDKDNDADYHNTSVAMLKMWTDKMKDDGSGVYSMCAAAVMQLHALGWHRSTDIPGVDTEEPPTPRRRQRRALAAWFWPFTMGALAAAVALAALQQLT